MSIELPLPLRLFSVFSNQASLDVTYSHVNNKNWQFYRFMLDDDLKHITDWAKLEGLSDFKDQASHPEYYPKYYSEPTISPLQVDKVQCCNHDQHEELLTEFNAFMLVRADDLFKINQIYKFPIIYRFSSEIKLFSNNLIELFDINKTDISLHEPAIKTTLDVTCYEKDWALKIQWRTTTSPIFTKEFVEERFL